MLAKSALVALVPFFLASAAATPCKRSGNGTSLNGSCAPGGNFNLADFTLQLPVGNPGSPESISSSRLEGCKGYTEKDYFFTESDDGAMVMLVPGSPSATGCVTTKNSKHCRTELRENGSWDPTAATNRMQATLAVPTADDSEHGTVIGQIHIDDSVSSKPVCELFINQQGAVSMGVEQTRSGGNEKVIPVGSVTPGKQFSYEIAYEGGKLSVALNGGSPKQLDTYQLDSPKSYFKAGNYNQGSSKSEVHFYALSVQH